MASRNNTIQLLQHIFLLLLLAASSNNAQQVVEFTVQIDADTTDSFTVEVYPEWSPLGAERFLELTRSDFWENVRFFRVVDDFVAQFGIHGDPAVAAEWKTKTLQDEPVVESNSRGTLTYARAGDNTRTTQIFINLKDNSFLDSMGFSPFAKVASEEDMAVVEMLYAGYGDGPPDGNGPSQTLIQSQGNAYLQENFPQLSYIQTVQLLNTSGEGAGADTGGPAANNEDMQDDTSNGSIQKIPFLLVVLTSLVVIRESFRPFYFLG